MNKVVYGKQRLVPDCNTVAYRRGKNIWDSFKLKKKILHQHNEEEEPAPAQ